MIFDWKDVPSHSEIKGFDGFLNDIRVVYLQCHKYQGTWLIQIISRPGAGELFRLQWAGRFNKKAVLQMFEDEMMNNRSSNGKAIKKFLIEGLFDA